MPDDTPYHAHIYFLPEERGTAESLKQRFEAERGVLFIGRMTEGKAGPHPVPQYEIHFHEGSLDAVRAMIRSSGLRALIHPLTDDDFADHTSLGEWIGGEPLDLDLTTLDPPGMNQSIPRFGRTDF